MAEWGSSILQTSDKGYIIAGQAKSNNGDVTVAFGKDDFWVLKLSPESSPTSAPISFPLNIYPNPAQNSITLKLPTQELTIVVTITDLLGQKLSRQTISNDQEGSAVLDISGLPTDLYLVAANTSSGQVFFGKVLKQE
jgi:Secretion system C-terminal sorting domain